MSNFLLNELPLRYYRCDSYAYNEDFLMGLSHTDYYAFAVNPSMRALILIEELSFVARSTLRKPVRENGERSMFYEFEINSIPKLIARLKTLIGCLVLVGDCPGNYVLEKGISGEYVSYADTKLFFSVITATNLYTSKKFDLSNTYIRLGKSEGQGKFSRVSYRKLFFETLSLLINAHLFETLRVTSVDHKLDHYEIAQDLFFALMEIIKRLAESEEDLLMIDYLFCKFTMIDNSFTPFERLQN